MATKRSVSQKVESFTASKEMLREAQTEAMRRRMTKSGFYRFCLAKELGRTEQEAMRIAEHASIGHFNVLNAETSGDNSPVIFKSASTGAPAAKPYPKPKRGQKKTPKK